MYKNLSNLEVNLKLKKITKNSKNMSTTSVECSDFQICGPVAFQH